tara:strand:+ start:510 stop:980 length:471 start_codon:yes stop_codon:yes gene_type:complete
MCNEEITIIVEDTVNSTEINVTSEDLNISLEITEETTDVSVLAVEQVNEVSIDVNNEVTNVEILVEPNTSVVAFTLSDDLVIVTAGKQSNTFVNNVFTFVNTVNYTNNTKTLVYTGDLLTGANHLFRYGSKNWNVNYTYNYILGNYSGVTKTITKS